MVAYADTSYLFSLYAHDAHTGRALKWLREWKKVITLCELTEFELSHGLRFAEFRQMLEPGQAAVCWQDYEVDRQAGRIDVTVVNLARVVASARRLSTRHTLLRGHRSFDILHLAAALEIGAKTFLTFDRNQKSLAKAEGLSLPL